MENVNFDGSTIVMVIAGVLLFIVVVNLIIAIFRDERKQSIEPSRDQEQRAKLGHSVLGEDLYIDFTGIHGRINVSERPVDHSGLEIKPTPLKDTE
jgi:hypothetical protein